jgi:hypothetical protein
MLYSGVKIKKTAVAGIALLVSTGPTNSNPGDRTGTKV